MTDSDWLAQQFETHRSHMRSVALRMLGSGAEADDAVQEAWVRLSRSDSAAIENLGGWLTTVVGRVALDMLRSRSTRREDAGDDSAVAHTGPDPEEQAVLADSVGAALLVVLDTLAPDERLAFVLHDTFGVPFDEIGTILDRSTDAAKQLAHRARRKVQGTDADGVVRDPVRQRAVVDAFLAAAREGQFDALVSLLHPDIVLRADDAAVRMGSPGELVGAQSVAGMFSGRALGAVAAMVDGNVGMMWAVDGRTRVVWAFTLRDDRVAAIEMIADGERLASLDLAALA